MKDQYNQKLFKMAQKEEIILPESLDDKLHTILSDTKLQTKKRKVSVKAAILLAATLLFMLSTTAFAAVSLLQQRLESLNQERIEAYFIQLQTSNVGKDYKNREYSKEEEVRLKALTDAYESQGTFPEGELKIITNTSDYKGKGIAFLPEKSTFFLPEAELSDEELLQIIDFYQKREYSLKKGNEMLSSGSIELPTIIPDEVTATSQEELINHATDPTQDLVIPYTGDLSIQTIYAGATNIYLAGYDGIHKMSIGSSMSEIFYNDYDTEYVSVHCMVESKEGTLYLGVNLLDQQYNLKAVEIWEIDRDGQRIKTIDITPHVVDPEQSITIIREMTIDQDGRFYVRITTDKYIALILDKNGDFLTYVTDENYKTHAAGGFGLSKNGKMYTYIYGNEKAGIAAMNPQTGALEDIYVGIVPVFPLDLIKQGTDTDFIFWGYEGIFSYNLGDKEANLILPPYEAPCQWEGCLNTILPDGRVLFGECSAYEEVAINGSTQYRRVPESTTFYYVAIK